MDNEPTRVMAAANRRPLDQQPTVIREAPPELLQAATPPEPRTVALLQLAPDLQMRTFDPSKRIMPGVIRRDENGVVQKVAPSTRTAAPTDNPTVIAVHHRRSSQHQQPTAEEATVAWQEGRGTIAVNFLSMLRKRLASRTDQSRRRPGLSKITWAVIFAVTAIVGITTLQPPAETPQPSHHGFSGTRPLHRQNQKQPSVRHDPSKDKPAAVPPVPHTQAPSQLAGLERLAVDALLDGRWDTAHRAYERLLASDPGEEAYALTLRIISQERAQ